MRKPFLCDFHPSFLRPAATPQRAAPFPSTTSGGVFLRHHPASSPSCPPSNSNYIALVFLLLQYRFPNSKSFRHPRGLNAHGAGLNAHGAGLNAHGAGLNAHGAVQINTNNRLIILQLPHDLHHHRRNSLLEIRQIPQVENPLSTTLL